MREYIKCFPGDWAGQKCLQKKSEQISLQISYLLLFHFYTSLCLPMSAHSNETMKVVSPVKCPANSLRMEAKIRHIQHQKGS